MPRVLRLASPLAVLIALAVTDHAAAAQTITVDRAAPASGCGPGACPTIASALAAAEPGDTVSVSAGTYAEGSLHVTVPVTVQAQPGTVTVTGDGAGGPVFTLAAPGAALDGLDLVVPAGTTAVAAVAPGTSVVRARISRSGATGLSAPLVVVPGPSGGSLALRNTAILDAESRSGSFAAPTVSAEAGTALTVADCRIVGGPNAAAAVRVAGTGTGSRVDRSIIVTTAPQGAALQVVSAADDAAAKVLDLDSTILVAATGTALQASSAPSTTGSSVAGNVLITLNHVTIPSGGRSVVIDAAANGPGPLTPTPPGMITVRARSSIIHGPAAVTAASGAPLQSPGSATLAISGSDTDVLPADAGGGATVTVSASSDTAEAQLLAAPTVPGALDGGRLRQGAPGIDGAPEVAAGESTLDVEGDPRTVGSAPDIGADEFRNRPPTAVIARSPVSPRQGGDVRFDASGSADPEQAWGGGISSYRWSFGDGTTQVTDGPVVVHAFHDMTTYASTVTVSDTLGVATSSAPVATLVRDGIGPRLIIVKPAPNSRLPRIVTVTREDRGRVRLLRRRARVRFVGTTQDDASGAGPVQIALRLVRPARKGPKPTTRRCRFLDPRKGRLVGRACEKTLFFEVPVRQGVWEYRTHLATILVPGRYRLIVRGVDLGGSSAVVTRMFTLQG